jgi:predicted MPP superfamily phosphohydrolase
MTLASRTVARLLASTVLLSQLVGCGARPPPSFAPMPAEVAGQHFSVVGDLQGTMLVERLVCREDNRAERQQLLPEIARTRPAFVVMLGDLVSWGASASDWSELDEQTTLLRRMNVGVLAVPGNHDYYGGERLRRYFARLPHLHRHRWYERRYGALALIFLDSNAGRLRRYEWREQQRWYEATLSRLDADPSVRGVLVFLHHSPWTNSSVVDDDGDVLSTFVPAFRRKKKTMAMLSGHAHGYERFEAWGKALIVSGGGGGPRGPLLTGSQRRHPDEMFAGPALRNFNFLELTQLRSGLHTEVVGLPKESQTFCRMEAFDLPWPAGTTANDALPEAPTSERATLRDCYQPAPKAAR